MEWTVIFHVAEEGGYWAEVPSLPGCYSQGETMEEAVANIRDAIESHLEALSDEGKEIPKEKLFMVGTVEVVKV